MVVLFYIGVAGALMTVLQLPLDYFSGFCLEHRFGLSRQSRRDWFVDYLKGIGVASVLSVIGIETVYALLRYQPERWWIYASLMFTGFVVLIANVAPVLLFPLFYKFKPVQSDDLRRRVDRLRRRTNAGVCGVFEWSLGEKTRKANAAVVGWGNTRRILVSDTLLRNFSGEEIEVIMAHELCHHVKGHMWWGILMEAALSFGTFFTINEALRRFTVFRGLADAANFPVIALTGIMLSAALLPVVNGFSRQLEKAADRFAIEVTGDAFAFVSSMEKLADLNLANKSPNKIIEFFFYSHPSVEARIKLAADRVGQLA